MLPACREVDLPVAVGPRGIEGVAACGWEIEGNAPGNALTCAGIAGSCSEVHGVVVVFHSDPPFPTG
jgi:hypothetical protein